MLNVYKNLKAHLGLGEEGGGGMEVMLLLCCLMSSDVG